jgi:hypothetical protein
MPLSDLEHRRLLDLTESRRAVTAYDKGECRAMRLRATTPEELRLCDLAAGLPVEDRSGQ